MTSDRVGEPVKFLLGVPAKCGRVPDIVVLKHRLDVNESLVTSPAASSMYLKEKLAEATRKFSNLRNELKRSQEETMKSAKAKRKSALLLSRHKTDVPARKLQELKLAFSEYYLSLILLQNYQNLNFTGFRKILKKHDKLLNVDVGAKWRAEHVDISHFYVNKDINHLISETEATVTSELEEGDRQKAMKRLRVPPLGEQQSPWTTFKVGLFLGCFAILFAIILLRGM
ncbi:xenotropic and polytropic retrovirus receptor 1-like [Diaphorina citri]|uniref:Xenotropic and polytropic retrovirus receptor 1-like n=1 Tax=Diaphorina citri TaxID=121845 RepID=A0A3Q0JPH0_DIACI|nr:xenotropic and polytropic retrovirus receptor 1-like [Diaphorina citri]